MRLEACFTYTPSAIAAMVLHDTSCFGYAAGGRCGRAAGEMWSMEHRTRGNVRLGTPECSSRRGSDNARSARPLAQQTRRARLRHACFEASEAINLTTRNVTRSSFRARTTGAESLELLPLAGLSFIASARQHCSRMCRMQVLAMRLSIARIQLFLDGGSNLAVLIVGKQQQSQKAAPEDVRGIQRPDHPR
jgi:hypothetical protein